MFVFSNDWFFGTHQLGLDLYDSAGLPISGDVTNEILLLDAGTEADETCLAGPAPAGPNTGSAAPDQKVRVVDSVGAVSGFASVTVTPEGDGEFTRSSPRGQSATREPGPGGLVG